MFFFQASTWLYGWLDPSREVAAYTLWWVTPAVVVKGGGWQPQVWKKRVWKRSEVRMKSHKQTQLRKTWTFWEYSVMDFGMSSAESWQEKGVKFEVGIWYDGFPGSGDDSDKSMMQTPCYANKKQGQKLVLSDALAVQFQGLRVSRSKGFKSWGCFGISKMLWDLKKCFGISKCLG